MEEPGEQCTDVFALIVTDPASDFVCVKGWMGGGGGGVGGGGRGGAPPPPPPPPLAGTVKICAKTTVHCSPGSSMVSP
jgi:hypothetical protein